MSDAKKLCGCQSRKRKLAEEKNENIILQKTFNIELFFGGSSIAGSSLKEQDKFSVSENEHDNLTAQQVEVQLVTKDIDEIENKIKKNEPLKVNELACVLATKKSEVVFELNTDPALWKCDEETRDYVSKHGVVQSMDLDFSSSKNVYSDKETRYISPELFQRRLKNGETQRRSWLLFSESKGAVFCVPCLLFGRETTAFTGEGFRDWKNAKSRVEGHENSNYHKANVNGLKERGNIVGRMDSVLVGQLEQIMYWRKVLHRVVDVVKVLAERGLPLRGSIEKLGNRHGGNFLASMELVAQFDPVLSEHLQRYKNVGRGGTSYLSKTIYEEFILLLHDQLLTKIVSEAKAAKYFSISVDSTPDIAHVDKLTFVIRYVSESGEPVETFIGFIANTGQKSEEIADAIFNVLKQHDLDIQNCRGQSYDNASNMSGRYTGVRARIRAINPLVDYVPCAVHSLNLVGQCAAESINEAADFFTTLQEVYNFFVASTHRWEILVSKLDRVLKRACTTHWSTRYDACFALHSGWPGIIAALQYIAGEDNETPKARSEAKGLLSQLERRETAFLIVLWSSILKKFNCVSKRLQDAHIQLATICELYSSLAEFLQELRSSSQHFDRYEEEAKVLCGIDTYSYDTRRKRIRACRAGETRDGETRPKNGRDNFRINVYYAIIDALSSELQHRAEAYSQLHKKFSFLDKLFTLDAEELGAAAAKLKSHYPEDLEETLRDECIYLSSHVRTHFTNKENSVTAIELYQFLRKDQLQEVYPNVDIALRMFLSIPATNFSGAQSFSTLNQVKTYLRANMGQDRRNALALLTIHAEMTKKLNCDEIIDKFATTKARRKAFE